MQRQCDQLPPAPVAMTFLSWLTMPLLCDSIPEETWTNVFSDRKWPQIGSWPQAKMITQLKSSLVNHWVPPGVCATGLLRGAGMTQKQLHHWKSTGWWLVIHKSGTSQEPPASCRHLDKRESLSLVVLTSVYHEESAVVLTCIQGLPETCELFTSWVLMNFPRGRDYFNSEETAIQGPLTCEPNQTLS